MHAAQLRRAGGTRSHGARAASGTAALARETLAPRRRSHGDPTGSQPRPQRGGGHRQAHVQRHSLPASDMIRRRRANLLFTLVLAAGSTLFLAATTKEPAMRYLFAISFLALCGYLYLLSQVRQREVSSWPQDWMQYR